VLAKSPRSFNSTLISSRCYATRQNWERSPRSFSLEADLKTGVELIREAQTLREAAAALRRESVRLRNGSKALGLARLARAKKEDAT
jgi:hypothetical protein